jgi:hypothetical protein
MSRQTRCGKLGVEDTLQPKFTHFTHLEQIGGYEGRKPSVEQAIYAGNRANETTNEGTNQRFQTVCPVKSLLSYIRGVIPRDEVR